MFPDMKRIEGYEDYYVTTSGKVFSFKKGVLREIKQYKNEKGYCKVWLYNKGKRKMFYVHRLVLLTFKPIQNSELYEVNHKDGVTDNNNLSNLEWLTPEENMKHALEELREFHSTRENIEKASELFKSGMTITNIAKEIGCSRGTVYNMLEGEGLWVKLR